MAHTTAEQHTAAAGTAGREWDLGAWSNPVTGVLALYLAGIVLYPFGLAWWAVALVVVLAGAALTWAVRRSGFRTLAVVYTGACAGVAAAWLTFASQLLTFDIFHIVRTGKCLLTLIGACLPLAIIYFVLLAGHGRAVHAAYLAERSVIERRSVTVDAVRSAKIRGWALTGERLDGHLQIADFEIQAGGTTLPQALGMIEALEVALKAPFRGAVRLERPAGGHVGQVRLTCARRSVLAELVPAPAVPAEPRSILAPLATGRFEDGQTAAEVYAYTSTSSIGQRDSGKTGLQNILIDNYASCADCLVWNIDFKQGSVVRHWLEPFAKGQADRPVFDWIGFTVADVFAMVAELDRIATIRARGRRGDKITPAPDLPAIRLIIDEIADLTAAANTNHYHRQVVDLLVKVVRKHRSEGMDIDILSQRATMSMLGPNSRDLLSQITHHNVLRVDSASEVFNTLSIPMEKLGGVDPSEFTEPGSVLTVRPGSRKAVRRSYYLPTEQIPARAAAYAAWRPQLEPAVLEGASAAYRNRWNDSRVTALLASIRDDTPLPDHAENETEPVEQPEPQADSGERLPTKVPTASSASNTEAPRLRAMLHDKFGSDEGEARYHHARGRVALRTAVNHLNANRTDAVPSVDLIAILTAYDPTMFPTDLDGRALKALLAPYGVTATQIGRGPWGANARGYRRADLEAGLDRGPDATEPTDTEADDEAPAND